MNNKNYHTSITVNATPQEALEKIGRVSEWWAANYEGKSQQQGDEFTVHFGDTFVNFSLSEVVPDKKVVWNVTDCYLHWINDKTEWNGTQVAFEVARDNGSTRIDVTHVGLIPTCECYNDCKAGWDGHIQTSLKQFIDTGKGSPQ